MSKLLLVAAGLGLVVGTGAYITIKNIDKSLAKVQQLSTESVKQQEEAETKKSTPTLVDLNDKSFVLLYGPIGDNAKQVANAIRKAAKENKSVWLLIDSPGGSVISGAQIVTAIERSGVEVNTVCLRLCASMAAVIHQYGTNRYMVDRSFLMFHEASGGISGTVPQMVSQVTSINRYVNKMLAYVASRAGMSFKDLDAKLAAELWLDSDDSLTGRFSDGTVEVLFEETKAVNPPDGGPIFPFFSPTNDIKVNM